MIVLTRDICCVFLSGEIDVTFAHGVIGNDVAKEDEVVEDPNNIGSFGHELRNFILVKGKIFVEDIYN